MQYRSSLWNDALSELFKEWVHTKIVRVARLIDYIAINVLLPLFCLDLILEVD